MAYGESNGHVIDDVMTPRNSERSLLDSLLSTVERQLGFLLAHL